MAIHGKTAPVDVPPSNLRVEGVNRTNHSQMLPHTSREMIENMHEYYLLCNAFHELFPG
jgi:hypothetical protein